MSKKELQFSMSWIAKSGCQIALAALIVLLLVRPECSRAVNSAWIVQTDPLTKIFSEQGRVKELVDTPAVARNSHAEFQVVLMAESAPLSQVSVSVSPFVRGQASFDSIRTGFVGYVGVSKLAPETFPGVTMPHSHLFPDPIMEVQDVAVIKGGVRPIWVSVYVPLGIPKGVYSATITVTGMQRGHRFTLRKPLSLRVYDVDMPEPSLDVDNQFSLDNFKVSYDKGWRFAPHNSEAWKQLLRETARKLRESYNNTVLISPLQWTSFSKRGSRWQFDFSQFDMLVDLFRSEGVLTNLEGGFIAQRKGGWESDFVVFVPEAVQTGEGTQTSLMPINSASARQFYSQFMPALYQHIKSRYPDLNYYQRIADEVIDANADSYMQIARYVKRVCPQMKLMETTATAKVGSLVDVLVPELEYYHNDYSAYTQLQKQGHQVWFYTCYLPQDQYANRFIEQPLLLPRLLHWLNFRYGATGYLHWGFNRWTDGDPYKETIQDQGGGIILPGGDSWIMYPSAGNRLYGSIRLDAMRDGIEDYTLLQMLASENEALAQQLCGTIVSGWKSYELDTETFRNVRKALLAALENNRRK